MQENAAVKVAGRVTESRVLLGEPPPLLLLFLFLNSAVKMPILTFDSPFDAGGGGDNLINTWKFLGYATQVVVLWMQTFLKPLNNEK